MLKSPNAVPCLGKICSLLPKDTRFSLEGNRLSTRGLPGHLSCRWEPPALPPEAAAMCWQGECREQGGRGALQEAGCALLGEGAGEEPDEGDGGSHGRRGPAADAVGEDADDGRAEKNHSHGQGSDPCWGERGER